MKITADRVTAERYSMEYITFGGGDRPIVILPGMGLRSVIPSAGQIAAQYACFCEKYKVYLIERKNDMEEGYTVSDMADDTADAMTRLGISGACVLGISQGGMIAGLIAARNPALVSRLVLASTSAKLNDTARETFTRWISLARDGRAEELNRDMFGRIYSAEYYEKYREEFALFEKMGTAEEIKRALVLALACLQNDSYEELGNISCPTLVIGAGDDRVLGCGASAEIAEKIGCGLYVYDGASHAVFDEAEDYPCRVLDFFDRRELTDFSERIL